jgi:MSHA pilin protein MshD
MCAERGRARAPARRQRGASLIEVVVFIVIVSIAAAAVLGALQWSARASPDPMIRKQLLAIAEAMLDEVTLQPFTWCDPTDANVATATGAGDCATLAEANGPEAGESRYSTTQPFNNVNDYDGFTMTGIRNVLNDAITGLDAYTVAISVAPATLSDASGSGAAALRVTVTATGPANAQVILQAFRTRYAPNSVN